MPQRYVDAILKYLADRSYQPLKPRQLARQMGVADEHYGEFREAIKQLHAAGRVALGARNALTLPEISNRVEGFYRPNPRGFGFVVPQTPNAHGDLFIPPGAAGGALHGDLVVAHVVREKRRGDKSMFSGRIVEILQRGNNRFVGTLQRGGGAWFVLPDGKWMTTPIVLRDVGAGRPGEGAKVVVEIVEYGAEGKLPEGVIVEDLGSQGQLEVETLAVIRAHGLEDHFSDSALADARSAVDAFDENDAAGREDLAALTVVTIDPPDARDFDDAISLVAGPGGAVLGIHIADVSHFVRQGTSLDDSAKSRGTSVYFPRRVVPMLPEILSNGVCSLQERQRRYCMSAFITYDAEGNRLGARFAETVISSAKRLTYQQAQDICDGKTGGFDECIVSLLTAMEALARKIEARRRKAGMLHLDLPEVQLVFDPDHRVSDAVAGDMSYSHTVIEMFMVEANEVVAEVLNRMNKPCLRRIHPAPDAGDAKQLAAFVHACGHKLPPDPDRRDMQVLLESVRGRPESYAVNLALLKTFERAEYSPLPVGHFALASEHYCHFTSPIRRYPDLTVHRLLREYCRGRLHGSAAEEDNPSELVKLGEHCSAAERRAQAAEDELREVLVLQFLQTRLGDEFDGVVTGVTNFGIFVQWPRFLIDGLVRLPDLGDDWWEVDARRGEVRGDISGRKFRIGDVLPVRIASVDVARRQLNLMPRPKQDQSKPSQAKAPNNRGRGKATPGHEHKTRRSRRGRK